jgi:predicted transcriptional regulator
MDTRVVTAHLPEALAKKLDGLAERLDRPKGWIVKEAIASFIALEEQRHRLTLEALADVDAGRMLDHTEVKHGLIV